MVHHIAVVGAGYAGLATAWHLLQHGASVSIFDAIPIGKGASGASAGLLHTFTGLAANLAWRGPEALLQSQQLLELASLAHGSPVFRSTPILRLALTEKQQSNYLQRSLEYAEVDWLTVEETQNTVQGISHYPSLLVKNGYCVYGQAYLNGLWRACEQAGASWISTEVETLESLEKFDAVVLATGASLSLASQRAQLPIKPVKGQLLQLSWPSDIPPLSMPVNSNVYCVMAEDARSCFVGATYEHSFSTALPETHIAKQMLLPKVTQMLPFLSNAELLDVRAGIRGATPNHLPLTQRLDKKTWVLAGFGSKGLLYHALFARELAQQITTSLASCPL
jgi:glycine/D-amino acid oxidase-like deaminating enzyme